MTTLSRSASLSGHTLGLSCVDLEIPVSGLRPAAARRAEHSMSTSARAASHEGGPTRDGRDRALVFESAARDAVERGAQRGAGGRRDAAILEYVVIATAVAR